MTFQLSQAQINFFHLFGFLHLPGLFAEEARMLQSTFDEIFKQFREDVFNWDHEAHYQEPRLVITNFIDRDPRLIALLKDPRLRAIATALAGDNFNFLSSDGNIFNGDTVWHTDSWNTINKHLFFKIAFYLDPMMPDTGGFRVVPGSHHQGDRFARLLHEVLPNPEETLGLSKADTPCVKLRNAPGDVTIFNCRLQHATCHTVKPRRMFHFAIAPRFPDPKLRLVTDMVRTVLNLTGKVYAEPLASNTDPLIAPHLQQLLSLSHALQPAATGREALLRSPADHNNPRGA